ncbi:MAG: zf-HC2 domain-containing protein, partial [Nitrospinota bacterium]|nr:zf-HC2 domain-containing protein [Nitrospinota bacterium]
MGVIRHMLDKIVPSRRRRWWVKCGDAFPVLSEFMDSELDPEMMARMQRHVEDCPPCRNLFRS